MVVWGHFNMGLQRMFVRAGAVCSVNVTRLSGVFYTGVEFSVQHADVAEFPPLVLLPMLRRDPTILSPTLGGRFTVE